MERDGLSWLAKRITPWAWPSLASGIPVARMHNGLHLSPFFSPATFGMLPIQYVSIHGGLLPEPSSKSEDSGVVYANQRQVHPGYGPKRRVWSAGCFSRRTDKRVKTPSLLGR